MSCRTKCESCHVRLFFDECVKKIDFPCEADVALVVVYSIGFGVSAAEMEPQVMALQRVELEAGALELDVATDRIVEVYHVVAIAVEAAFGKDNPFFAKVKAGTQENGVILGQKTCVVA